MAATTSRFPADPCARPVGGVDRLAGAFATLAPMVRDYLRERVFERAVDLDDKVVLRRLAENDAQQVVIGAFGEVIRGLAIEQREATIEESRAGVRHAAVPVVADNRFERRFARVPRSGD